jgi:hypothetical protein
MSGHLQRIAANVLSSARAFHPAVGSRWVAPSIRSAIETDSEALAPPVPYLTAARVEDLTAAQEQQATARPAVEPPAPEAAPIYESKAIPIVTEKLQPLPGATNPDATFMSIAPAKNQATTSPQAAETKPAPRPTFTPLLPEAPREQKITTPAVAITPTASLRNDKPTRSQPVAQSAREPGEIEIHIGRIEVTAALPQLVARPAPRPARKSLDLGEYLKRDRRSR